MVCRLRGSCGQPCKETFLPDHLTLKRTKWELNNVLSFQVMASAAPAVKSRKNRDTLRCTICSKQGGLIKLKNHHMQEHLKKEDVPFLCTLCGAKYLTARRLKDHVMHRHPDADQVVAMGGCGRFPDYDKLFEEVATPSLIDQVTAIMDNPALAELLRERLGETLISLHAPDAATAAEELGESPREEPATAKAAAAQPDTCDVPADKSACPGRDSSMPGDGEVKWGPEQRHEQLPKP